MAPKAIGAVCVGMATCGMVMGSTYVAAAESGTAPIVYLQFMLRARPQDGVLRSTLAHRLAQAGRWVEARQVLEPLLKIAAAADSGVQLAALEIDCSEFRALTPESAERQPMAKRLQDRIAVMLGQLTGQDALLRLAGFSLELERPGLAAQVYQRLAAISSSRRAQWLEKAAVQHLANDAPSQAAMSFEDASRAESDVAESRRLVFRAMDAWLANQQGRRALVLARANARFLSRDAEFMRRAIRIALAQGDVQWARGVGRRLLLLDPDSIELLDRQLDMELAVRDLNAALQLALRLVRLQPDSVTQRTRLARLADWTGHLELALKNWDYLCTAAPTPESMDRAMRNALALEHDATWLRLASQVSLKRVLGSEELEGLSAIAQRQNAPGPMVAFLTRYGQRYLLSAAQWEVMANAHAQLGQTALALEVWRRADTTGIGMGSLAAHRARLLVAMERPGDALDMLQKTQADIAPDEIDFWRASGDLEWEYGSSDRAAHAYRLVWYSGAQDAQVAERLIRVFVEQGETDQAVVIAEQAFKRLDQPRWLLLAMDAASRAGRWDLLRSSASQAQAIQARLSDSEMYWLLLAHSEAHDGHAQDASYALQQASALNPDDVPSRLQLLTAMVDNGLEQALAGHLTRWEADALQQPVYWPVYAMAQLHLGQISESLDWLERMAKARPQDYRRQADYVYWMRHADWSGLDAEAKDTVLHRLTVVLVLPQETPSAERGDLLLALEEVVREHYGPRVGDVLLQDMLVMGYRDTRIYRKLVDSSLQQKDFIAANKLMQAAHAQDLRLPAYQSLALAMEANDGVALASLLIEHGNELSAADHVSALRRMGHEVQALALADRELLDAPGDETERLLQHRDALREQMFSDVSAGYRMRDLAGLSLRSTELLGSMVNDAGRYQLRLRHTELKGDREHVVTDRFPQDDDVLVAADIHVAGDPVHLAAGGNMRSDQSIAYAQADWTHAWNPRTSMHLELALHTLSELTPALRAIGMQDKLAFVLQHALSDSLTGSAGVAAQQFSERNGTVLGQGYRAEAALERPLSGAARAWTLRVSGSTDNNRLADRLPSDLIGTVLPVGQLIEDVVPRHFSTLGAGARLRVGEQDGPRKAYGVFDVWAGQQWPVDTTAYTVRAVGHVPLNAAGTAQLQLDAHYTNVLGGTTVQSDRGLSMVLQYRF